MMVQIKLSVVYIFAAAAIAPVVVNGLPLPGKKNKFQVEDPKSGMIEGEILHTDLGMQVG